MKSPARTLHSVIYFRTVSSSRGAGWPVANSLAIRRRGSPSEPRHRIFRLRTGWCFTSAAEMPEFTALTRAGVRASHAAAVLDLRSKTNPVREQNPVPEFHSTSSFSTQVTSRRTPVLRRKQVKLVTDHEAAQIP